MCIDLVDALAHLSGLCIVDMATTYCLEDTAHLSRTHEMRTIDHAGPWQILITPFFGLCRTLGAIYSVAEHWVSIVMKLSHTIDVYRDRFHAQTLHYSYSKDVSFIPDRARAPSSSRIASAKVRVFDVARETSNWENC